MAQSPGSSYRAAITLAESMRRATDRLDPSRMSGSRDRAGCIRPEASPQILLRILSTLSHAFVLDEGCPDCTTDSANRDRCDRSDSSGRRITPSPRTNCCLNDTVRPAPHTKSCACVCAGPPGAHARTNPGCFPSIKPTATSRNVHELSFR